MAGLELNHVSKRGVRCPQSATQNWDYKHADESFITVNAEGGEIGLIC